MRVSLHPGELLYGEAAPARSTSVSGESRSCKVGLREANNRPTGRGQPLPSPTCGQGDGGCQHQCRQAAGAVNPRVVHQPLRQERIRRHRGRSSIFNQHQLQSSCFWRTVVQGQARLLARPTGGYTGQVSEGGTLCKISSRFFIAKIVKIY